MAKNPTIFPRDNAQRIVNAPSGRRRLDAIRSEIAELPTKSAWYVVLSAVLEVAARIETLRPGPNALLPWEPIVSGLARIFVKGNGKLPYWQFSALPFATCPGMGDCGRVCYSVRAWRYPQPFGRQLLNTILLESPAGRTLIARAFRSLPDGSIVRLYVDGDLRSLPEIRFWMGLIAERPDLRVFGYTKSWAEMIAYDRETAGNWPLNYALRQSGGSKWEGTPLERQFQALVPVRGPFDYFDTEDPKQIREELRKRYPDAPKVFVCPGKCGECIKVEGAWVPACEDKKFQCVPIGIGTH